MIITIIGAGYVGLTSAAVYARLGHTVWLLECDEKKSQDLKNGIIPFYEPGLKELVGEVSTLGHLKPTTDIKEAIREAQLVFICVGTPSREDGSADLSQVETVAQQIASHLGRSCVVVNKSTVPVGTAERVQSIIKRSRIDAQEIEVASCPEFLREGNALHDLLNPDRVVIGAASEHAQKLLIAVHDQLPGQRVVTDVKTAEMIKYASNAFLATKISFINEMANVCELVGANIEDVARGMGSDPRIGSAFLKAGIGYGGSCFPKDTRALSSIAAEYNYDFQLLKSVIEVNQRQRERFVEKIQKKLTTLSGKVIAVLGLTFKNNTDDVRESSAIDIIRLLRAHGAVVRAYDPVGSQNARKIMPDITICPSIETVVKGADAVCILTEWNEFQSLQWLESIPPAKRIVFDGRNICDVAGINLPGTFYMSVGRPDIRIT